MDEEQFLKECLRFLDYFGRDYSGDIIYYSDGDYSCIANPKSEWYENFGGYSIFSVIQFVAKRLNKKIKYKE